MALGSSRYARSGEAMTSSKASGLSRCARSGVARQNYKKMEYYVYILKSLKNGDFYVGSTSDYKKRVDRHNAGLVKSTKGYKPWKLIEVREFTSRREAILQERFLKNRRQKEILKNKYGVVAK